MDKKNKWGIVVVVLLSLLIVSSTCFYFFFDKIFSSYSFFDKFSDDVKNSSKENLVKIKKLALVIANNQESEIIIEDNKKIGDYDSITWESSDSSIVDVSSCKGKKCKIKGKNIGEVTIIAKDSKHGSDTIIVSVAEPDTINFYISKDQSDYIFSIKKSAVEADPYNDYNKYYNLLTTYSCKTLDCNNISSGYYYTIIKDGDLYEFNYRSNSIVAADDILKDYDSFEIIDNSKEILAYKFYINNDDDDFDNNRYILYSKSLNKEIINTTSFVYSVYSKGLLEKNIGVISLDNNVKLINLKENKELYSTKNVGYVFDTSINGHTIYGFSETNFYNKKINTFYLDENFNELFDGNIFYLSNIVDNKLYGVKSIDDKKYYIYDYDGSSEISEVKLNNILDIYDDGILCVDDLNKLVLLGLEGSKKIDLYDWNNKYNYAHNSGYSTRDGKTGYYVIFENSEIEYGTDGHAIVIYYNPADKKVSITKQGFTGMEGKAKPVLYLYPKKSTKVKVNLEGFSTLTTTYPKYNNGWEVIAKNNGDLYDKDGKYYYGLYWEEESPRQVDFSSGFYVEKDNAIDFLEEKLSYIGLNDKERNEFIMYWLPILEKNGKNLVYFELTDELESYTHLNINPKPDSLLRVTIHIKKIDHRTYIKEETLKPFNRKGFTAVEWGGINY